MTRPNICLLFILLGVGSLLGAELKVAVVDEQALLESYQKSQDFVQSLKDQFRKEEASLKALNDKISDKEKSLEKQLRILGPEPARQLYEEFTRSKIELEVREKALRETHVFSKNQYTLQVIQDINDALEAIGAEGNYDLILRKYVPSPNGGEAQRNVLFHSDRLDITKEVLDYMNAKYRQSQK
jgi:Skp family chaperone for outer membrane proteins